MNFDLMIKIPLIKKYYGIGLSEFEALKEVVFCEKIFIKFSTRWDGKQLDKEQIRSIVNHENFSHFSLYEDCVCFAMDFICDTGPLDLTVPYSFVTEIEQEYADIQKSVATFIKEMK